MCASASSAEFQSPQTTAPRDLSASADGMIGGIAVPPLTSFVGREAQFAAVTALLRDPGVRLLTLAGPAGVGKTRLAEVAAEAVRDDFPDGVHVISFATLWDRERVPIVIAGALGLLSVTGESFESRIISHARERQMLLVLDNLEQLLPIPFLTRLLVTCPRMTILATSREVLHLSGEFEYVVPPLAVPDMGARLEPDDLMAIESVALLVERARQVQPAFAITPENAADVAAICARLDGLPLAIELAAARLKIFSPAALLQRLPDPLGLLTGGPADRPAHQRTIRDTIGWSHDLLDEREQRVFRRLGVFDGDITPDATVVVCHDGDNAPLDVLSALDDLISLVDKSLVQRHRQDDGEPRFYLLETVRHYALERLAAAGELREMRLRHARYFLEEAVRVAPLLMGAEQTRWIEHIERSLTNMRAAMTSFYGAADAESYTRLASALWRFWRLRGMLTEGRIWLEPTLDPAWQERLPADLRSNTRFMAGWLALEQGDVDHAQTCGDVALAVAREHGDHAGMGFALRLLSFIDSRLNNNERALTRMIESLEHHRKANDLDSIAGALNKLAILSLDSGAYEQVLAYCEESREAFTRLGNLHGASHSIDTMGVALYCLERYDEAMQCSLESLAIDRQLDNRRGLPVSLDHVGKCARALHDLPGAWAAHTESLRYRQEVGDPRGLLVWLEAMARWLMAVDDAALAALALGTIEVTRTASTIPIHLHERADHEVTEALARERLGDARFEAMLAKGRWVPLDEMVVKVRDAAIAQVDGVTQPVLSGPSAGEIAIMFRLTPREREVLELLARRYTDKEIAWELSISPRTVARHVTGIFTKLGVHSRREAAMMMHRTSG